MHDDHSYEQLIRQAQQADPGERQQILERLVTQFAEAGLRWAMAVLEDEDAAHDALQDAWLNAYLHLDQLRESAAFPSWFRQIVLTSCYRSLRHDDRSMPLSDDDSTGSAAPQADPTDEIEQEERRDHIREAVMALPDGERIVTELFYFGEVPQQEIAEVLAVPVTTVKKRLQYARRHLKGLIQPEIVSRLNAHQVALECVYNGGCLVRPDDVAAGLLLDSAIIQERSLLCSACLEW